MHNYLENIVDAELLHSFWESANTGSNHWLVGKCETKTTDI